MDRKPPVRVDSSTPAIIDLSPGVVAERVKRLAQVRRTANVAKRVRESIAEKYGRTKP